MPIYSKFYCPKIVIRSTARIVYMAALLLIGCESADRKDEDPKAQLPAQHFTPFDSGSAEKPLGAQRARKLRKLEAALGARALVTLDSRTGAIKHLVFDYAGDAAEQRKPEVIGAWFVGGFTELLDPMLRPGELVLQTENQCYQAQSSRGGLRYGRVIENLAVLGSQLTLRFAPNGRLASVENSLASIPKNRLRKGKVAVDPAKFLPQKVLEQAARNSRVMTHAVPVKQPQLYASTPVLVPHEAAGIMAMVQGELVVFPTPGEGSGTGATVVLTSGETMDPWDTGSDIYVPQGFGDAHIDSRTSLPDFISFRRQGGVAINGLGASNDPVEAAFRFLEQYPSVFRSGDARCQFQLREVASDNQLGGIDYVKLQQVIAGIPVFGAELVFEIENGQLVQSVQGHILPNANMVLEPVLSVYEATAFSRQALQAQAVHLKRAQREAFIEMAGSGELRGAELVIFPGQLHSGNATGNKLAYKVSLAHYELFIDAGKRTLLYGYSLRHGRNVVVEGGGFTDGLLDRPNYFTINIDGVPINLAAPGNTDAVTAIADLATTAGFFATLGRNGINGRGSDFTAITNVAINAGCNNAYFEPYISNNAFFCLGVARNDVMTHEMTHGVIAYSSGLIYLDESGALNESYADILGNVAFPDALPAGSPAGTLPAWNVGEAAGLAGCATGGTRDMANPALCGDPATMGAYLSRTDLGCALTDILGLGAGCDNGGVHSNSGITNRAHVIMADGQAPGIAGIGRGKMGTLAFDVMARRLGLFSRLLDAALATRARCETLVAMGGVDMLGSTGAFAITDCDTVINAFNQVGLDPNLMGGWVPTQLGFAGTIARFAGETTANACPITDVRLTMITPSGVLDANALAPGGATINYAGLLTATIPTTTPPIGGTAMGHIINWTSAFGYAPSVNSSLIAPAPAGASDCINPPGLTGVQRTSATLTRSVIPNGWGGTNTIGPVASTMNPACVLNNTQVEIVNGDGFILGGPGATAQHAITVWVFFVPVTVTRDVTLVAQPPGIPNLSAPVAWGYGVAFLDIRFRLRYFLGAPAGVACVP